MAAGDFMLRYQAILLSTLITACGGGGGSSSSVDTPISQTPEDSSPILSIQAAARVADQTTFGASYDEIEHISNIGTEAWLEQQFSQPIGFHEPIVRRYVTEYGYDTSANPHPGFFRRFAFWEQALAGPDPLRQLVAYSLTQVLVVSEPAQIFNNPLALSNYYDTLLEHSFGNFQDLLLAVTLHPAMGVYLSHVNNAKTDPDANTFPDENFAREVMQLFTIGLYELNADGSRKLDASNVPIPTYDNRTIRDFSKIFTGLSYGVAEYSPDSFFGKKNGALNTPMVMFEPFHESGEKFLLNDKIVPDGQSGIQDIKDAVENLFQHPNIGPFVGKQLIQRLVTSNPSADYVARVTAAFNGDDTGIRGDMRAVLMAIFTDPEAGNAMRVREPFRRYVAINRSLEAKSTDGLTYPGLGLAVQNLTGQFVLAAPSVFGFYSPFYRPDGPAADSNLVSPELQITTEDTVVGMANLIAYTLYTDNSIDTPNGYPTINIDLSILDSVADNNETLLNHIELLFFGGAMPAHTRSTITDTLTDAAGLDTMERIQLALYLALISPDQAVIGEAI